MIIFKKKIFDIAKENNHAGWRKFENFKKIKSKFID
jgi:hypothetical protein